ncbi:SpvB/TcaC N-terminal domain-containing protein [Micromonospora vulcania]|uniref:SpvB/TcaC N-terminal domain-containing protein n=1 Tax=Micromonospora vulcania TaxID=1441873 RepID=A0ABW1HDA3_9ACTN
MPGPDVTPPAVTLPKGGGAARGIGEKFAADPATGAGSMTVPIASSPGRNGFGPQLALGYDSGAGDGPFGLGWSLGLPAITRRTDTGIPRYDETDVYLLSGAEDLTPVLKEADDHSWVPERLSDRRVGAATYAVRRYRPRVEGLFARIERWTNVDDAADVFWRSISRDDVTTWYGRTAESRIADPADPRRIFSWLISETHDDKGDLIAYGYRAENDERVDTTLASERNRTRGANRYLKRVRYGNHRPYLPVLGPEAAWPALPGDDEWFFELVFDYGDEDGVWPARKDPFSVYRAGFEVRNHRLCQRVLMLHHFPDVPEVGAGCLVRSTDFDYSHDLLTKLTIVTQRGHQRHADGYRTRSLPPVEFGYTEAQVQGEWRELAGDSLDNLPVGLDGAQYRWIDLDGDGLPGVLTEQGGTWFYKRNRSEAGLGPLEVVASRPALALADGAQFLDLAGDGRPDVVRFTGPVPGFQERDGDGWGAFTAFRSLPGVDFGDPEVRLADLDGDGLADLLVAEPEAMSWHQSLGENGFGPRQRIPAVRDVDRGPDLALADMSGDGLSDLVRIGNGEVCYWPNLGHGRFGPKVTMDGAPRFDRQDRFDPHRVLLADVDGSGRTDIIYLHADGIRVYLNRAGNGWTEAVPLPAGPSVGAPAGVHALDLFGNGTACLVWSSPLPADAGRPVRYLDLMGGQKPHLLVRARNNLGTETEIEYAPSTRYYLRDRAAGTPWVTRLPFPVHVVSRATVRDRWLGTSFTSTYSYHHGYFDGPEREFRGFGRVEQVDVEDYGTFAAANPASPYVTADHRLYQPPVKTITWFHTGAPAGERALHQLTSEYRRFPGPFSERVLPEPDLRDLGVTTDERREALRACKGVVLRQEVYELDAVALQRGRSEPVRLFSVTSHSCRIELVQPRGPNRHAVFHVTDGEEVTYHHELDLRDPASQPDPRISHRLNLEVDELGNVRQTVTVGYPRRPPTPTTPDPLLPDGAAALIAAVQGEMHVTYARMGYTGDVVADPDDYRLRLPCETRTYEVTGVWPAGDYFTPDEVLLAVTSAATIPSHVLPDRRTAQKRLVGHDRSVFFTETLDAALPLGEVTARALPYETYSLALTDGLLTAVFDDRLTAEVTVVLDDEATSGYRHEPESGHWRCSGTAGFQATAAQHFLLPERYTDPFGNVTLLEHDPHDLYLRASTDALGNRTEVVGFDFRVLAPDEIEDVNGNRSQVRFDVLGRPAALAMSGKAGEGERLGPADDDLDAAELAAFFGTDDYDPARAVALLGEATTRYLHHLGETVRDGEVVWGEHPSCAAVITREQHADLPGGGVQTAFEYSGGTGGTVVQKVQAEPATAGGPLRWVGNGRTVLNNKGKPVKQYEPYFSPASVGHRFEDPPETGVTPVLFYDAVGRLVRTDHPDGTWSRAEFSPWQVAAYDPNDTVLEPDNAWYSRMSTSTAGPERRAARMAAGHADTPPHSVLDSLGRTVLTVDHNRTATGDVKHVTFTRLAADGQPLWVQDARGNRVMQYVTPPSAAGPYRLDHPENLAPTGGAPGYDLAGESLFQHGMDGGGRWLLPDAAGKPLFAWNSRGFRSRSTYDALHRPVGVFVRASGDTTLAGTDRDPDQPPGPEVLVEWRLYGEAHPDPAANLRGRPHRVFDGAGTTVNEAYDFKGNLLAGSRRFAADHRGVPDWSVLHGLVDPDQVAAAAEPLLEPGPARTTRISYDALNRPVVVTTPDGSVRRTTFDVAGLLDRVDVELSGVATSFVTNVEHDARGRRQRIDYGNGATTSYEYDPLTLRLTRMRTTRPGGPDATASALFVSPAVVQDLRYTYDAVGNITRIEDAALGTTVQAGNSGDYAYDALYRLVAASGREHRGQTDFAADADGAGLRDHPFAGLRIHPNDLQGLRGYVERYEYDAVGNIERVAHHDGGDVDQPGPVRWQRRHRYAADSNRLLATNRPGDPDGTYSAAYPHDAHGNITGMSHLPLMRWDYRDRLCAVAQQVVNDGLPEITYYVYDSAGQRVRKVTDTSGGDRKSERSYLGDYEIYREYGAAGAVSHERETLQVSDDKRRIALVETATTPAAPPRLRFQFGNHLGSASVELDEAGNLIDYEEYHPYGTTAFQIGRSAAEVSLKRYRYTTKERDDESGFGYHGARYYAPWLGRWISTDPAGLVDGPNLYQYVSGSPVGDTDLTGTEGDSNAHTSTYTPSRPQLTSTDDALNHLASLAPDCKVSNVDQDKTLPVALVVRGDKMVMVVNGKEVSSQRAPTDQPDPEPSAPSDWPDSVPDEGGHSGYFAAGAAYGWLQHQAGISGMLKMPWDITGAHHDPKDEAAFAQGAAWALMLASTLDMATALAMATEIALAEATPWQFGGLGKNPQLALAGDIAMVRVNAIEARAVASGAAATLLMKKYGGGSAPAGPDKGDYRGRYNQGRIQQGKKPLPAEYDAHHRIPQEYRNRPDFKDFDFDAPSNIRGVKGWRAVGAGKARANYHGEITEWWRQFRLQFPSATRTQIEWFANQIDKGYARYYFR